MADEKTEVFRKLRTILRKHSRGLEVRRNTAGVYELYGEKSVTVGKRTVDGMYFGSAVIKTRSAALTFFPIYTHPGKFRDIPAALRKGMTGKSCFDVQKDKALFGPIAKMVKKGEQIYRRLGWI